MMDAAVTIPSIEAAAIWTGGTFQTTRAKRQVTRKAMGMALVAGQWRSAIKRKTTRIGRKAKRASMPRLIITSYTSNLEIKKLF